MPGRRRVLRRAGLVRLADRRHLALDRRDAARPTCNSRCGSTISALPVGGALMLVRYLIRLVRFVLLLRPGDDDGRAFASRGDAERALLAAYRPLERIAGPRHADPPVPAACSSACSPRACRSSWCSACAPAFSTLPSGEPLIGVAQVVIDHLNSTDADGAAVVRDGGGVHALRAASRRRWSMSPPPGSAASGARSASSPWWPARCSPRSAARASRPRSAMGTILLPAMIETRLSALLRARRGRRVGHHRHRNPAKSLALILYGIVAEQSVPRLFLAGVLPGLLQASVFFAWVLYDARRRNFPVEPALPFAERLRVTRARAAGAGGAARGDWSAFTAASSR